MSVQARDRLLGTAGTTLPSHVSDSLHTWSLVPNFVGTTGTLPPVISGLAAGTIRSAGTGADEGAYQISAIASADDYIVPVKWTRKSSGNYVAAILDVSQSGTPSFYKVNPHPDGHFYCDKYTGTFAAVTGDNTLHGLADDDSFEGYIAIVHGASTTITLYDSDLNEISQWIDASPLPATRKIGVYQNGNASSDTTGFHLDEIGLVDAYADWTALAAGTITPDVVGATRYSATGTAASGGDGDPITYQWHESDTPGFTPDGTTAIAGATSQNLALQTGKTPEDDYYVKRVDSDGTSSVATNELHIETSAALAGGTILKVVYSALFYCLNSVAASGGDGAITYQWQHDPDGSGYVDIDGETSATYQETGLTPLTDYGQYRRKAIDALGEVAYSNVVAITTSAPPTIGKLNAEAAAGLNLVAVIKRAGLVYDPASDEESPDDRFITPTQTLVHYGIVLDEIVPGYYSTQEPALSAGFYDVTYYNAVTEQYAAVGAFEIGRSDIEKAILYGTSVQESQTSTTRTMVFALGGVDKVRITYNKQTGERTAVEEL